MDLIKRESVPGYKPDSAIENARKLLAGKCQNTRKAAGRSKISQRADFAWSDEDEDEDEDKEGEDEDDDEEDSTDENEDEEEKACGRLSVFWWWNILIIGGRIHTAEK